MTPQPGPATIFQHLNQTRHRVNEDKTPNLFDTMLPDRPQPEYWLLSDLQNLYHTTLTFNSKDSLDAQLVPMIVDNRRPITYSNHAIVFTTKNPNMRRDARLSRYACWRVATVTSLDPFTQAYFLCPNADMNKIKPVANMLFQIRLRHDVARLEQQIGGILHRRGTDFRAFYRTANLAFFNDADVRYLKTVNGIDPDNKSPITNFLGPRALWARRYALEQTIILADHRPNPILVCAQIAFRAGRTKMIDTYRCGPETDIHPTTINQVQSQYNKIERNFIKTHIDQSIRQY